MNLTPTTISLSCIIASLVGLVAVVIVANWRLDWKVVEAWLEWDIQWRAKMRALDENIRLRGLVRQLLPHVRQRLTDCNELLDMVIFIDGREEEIRAEVKTLAELIEEAERECQR